MFFVSVGARLLAVSVIGKNRTAASAAIPAVNLASDFLDSFQNSRPAAKQNAGSPDPGADPLLPQQVGCVAGESTVNCDDSHGLDECLSDEKPIHWVSVMKRQIGSDVCVTHGDRKLDKPVRCDHRSHVARYPGKLRLLA
ncbi:MAG TPA: hypothetical protein VK741_12000 [Acetobacteraceae bacterium]|nr:hypothetical protein [Acetobacteraceae bacterium]